MGRKVSIAVADYNKLPEASAKDILATARKLAAALGKPLDDEMVNKASEEMLDTHRFGQYDMDQAKLLLKIEERPEDVLFRNERVVFLMDSGNEYWRTIKEYTPVNKKGARPTLADYRAFINEMYARFGGDTEFYMTSDRGDDYFVVTLKK
jgi:hypothetical protein